MNQETQRAIALLEEALALLKPKPIQVIDPNWFRESGRLSDRGIEYLRSLFAAGEKPYGAAKKMAISYRACNERFKEWQKLKN